MGLRLYVDSGGEKYLPFARDKLAMMKAAMKRADVRLQTKLYLISDSERIIIRSLNVGRDSAIDFIRIIAGAKITFVGLETTRFGIWDANGKRTGPITVPAGSSLLGVASSGSRAFVLSRSGATYTMYVFEPFKLAQTLTITGGSTFTFGRSDPAISADGKKCVVPTLHGFLIYENGALRLVAPPVLGVFGVTYGVSGNSDLSRWGYTALVAPASSAGAGDQDALFTEFDSNDSPTQTRYQHRSLTAGAVYSRNGTRVSILFVYNSTTHSFPTAVLNINGAEFTLPDVSVISGLSDGELNGMAMSSDASVVLIGANFNSGLTQVFSGGAFGPVTSGRALSVTPDGRSYLWHRADSSYQIVGPSGTFNFSPGYSAVSNEPLFPLGNNGTSLIAVLSDDGRTIQESGLRGSASTHTIGISADNTSLNLASTSTIDTLGFAPLTLWDCRFWKM